MELPTNRKRSKWIPRNSYTYPPTSLTLGDMTRSYFLINFLIFFSLLEKGLLNSTKVPTKLVREIKSMYVPQLLTKLGTYPQGNEEVLAPGTLGEASVIVKIRSPPKIFKASAPEPMAVLPYKTKGT